jgi:hypothetical protein
MSRTSESAYHQALRDAGHTLRMIEDEGEPPRIDIFVMDVGYHNGPGCVTCGDSWCHHCEDAISPCSRPMIEGEAVNVTGQRALPAPGDA